LKESNKKPEPETILENTPRKQQCPPGEEDPAGIVMVIRPGRRSGLDGVLDTLGGKYSRT